MRAQEIYSQWDCIRENIGDWHGSFAQYQPDGTLDKLTPSQLTLAETTPEQQMQLTLVRTPPEGPHTVRREFSYPGPAPHVYFFKTGAFSQGPLQYRGYAQFGAELSLKADSRRLRFVQMYEGATDGTSRLDYVTLIREQLDRPPPIAETGLQLSQLRGVWSGQTIVFCPTENRLKTDCSRWQIETEAETGLEIYDRIEPVYERRLTATVSQPQAPGKPTDGWRLMLLPDGAACLLQQQLSAKTAFTLEAVWLLSPLQRQRLIRCYDQQGRWTHLILAIEEKVSETSDA
ncbi:MAG: DUF3598 family protein [Leptolyngbya sp. SIO4C1]|nr:DUF3598 family protein [Leptolyngbya sp. SIO4C1]